MPVTARLSRRFYDRLGDDIANELVDWFNSVDATYRFELKEVNELNFARFDAKLGQRVAEALATVDCRFAELEARVGKRFVGLEAKFAQHFVELEAKFEQRCAALEAKFEKRLAATELRLMRWMFTFWVTNLIALAGLALTLRAR